MKVLAFGLFIMAALLIGLIVGFCVGHETGYGQGAMDEAIRFEEEKKKNERDNHK